MLGISDKSKFSARVVHSILEISRDDWNRLNRSGSPFLRHEFLAAMERHGAVGEQFGWLPRFLLALDEGNQLVGAMPMYEKDNSYGELVFDWAWAQAYYQHNIPYYPKLVCAIPYTPATGHRLLTLNDDIQVRDYLISQALVYCDEREYSSLHCLFPDIDDIDSLLGAGCRQRIDIQYHWFNNAYTDFDHFLSGMRNVKRKKIRQERRRIKDCGIDFTILRGNEVNERQWQDIHRFYYSTFAKKSGHATFSLEFFHEIAATMGEQIVIVLAHKNTRNIAAAINYCSNDVLYGRHWGCDEEIAGLHFETCYYQGIDYAINNDMTRFEPGAQGEYKFSRGFMPVLTCSAHWVRNEMFRSAIYDFISREAHAIQEYQQTLLENSPYKPEHIPCPSRPDHGLLGS